MGFKVPRRLGEWLIHDELGRGSTASVFFAIHYKDRDCCAAIKVVPGYRLDESKELYHESKVMNIVNPDILYQPYTVEAGFVYYVMQYFPLGSLAHCVLNKRPSMKLGNIGPSLINQVLKIHQAGWFHLDISPGNIMVLNETEVVVVDFGKAVDRTTVGKYGNRRMSVSGTRPFWGIHIWLFNVEAPRDDLESVGLVLAWVKLGGTFPWNVFDMREMERAVVDLEFPTRIATLTNCPELEDYFTQVRSLDEDEDGTIALSELVKDEKRY